MSQMFKYGNFERELDFLDIDFYEKLEDAESALRTACMNIPKEGKISERLSIMLHAYDDYFNTVFGAGASEKMFTGRNCQHRIDALNLITSLAKAENVEFSNKNAKYAPNKQHKHSNFKKYYK